MAFKTRDECRHMAPGASLLHNAMGARNSPVLSSGKKTKNLDRNIHYILLLFPESPGVLQISEEHWGITSLYGCTGTGWATQG